MTVEELKKALPKTKVFNIEFTDKVDYKKSKLGGSFYWPTENGPDDKTYCKACDILLKVGDQCEDFER